LPGGARKRRLAGYGVLAAAAVVAIVLLARPDMRHRIYVVTSDATGVIPGMSVEAAGQTVGTVSSATVTRDHLARLEIRLDDSVWPLPRDSRLQIRTGGTIKFAGRLLQLYRGPATASAIPDGGTLAARNVISPVGFDTVFGTFDSATRQNLGATVDASGAALRLAAAPLGHALDAAPAALAQAHAVLEQLGANPTELDTLIRAADSMSSAVDAATPGLSQMLIAGGRTLSAVGGEAQALKTALQETPRTLDAARTTLARADGTLTAVGTLMQRLSPGVVQLHLLARPLDDTLNTLEQVAPDLSRALMTVSSAEPSLVALLATLRTALPTLGSVARQGAEQFACIRPYTPELAGFFSTWGPGGWGSGDARDKYLRAEVGSYPFGNLNVLSTAQVLQLFPATKIAFPQPPGILVNQPWFQPQCGITAASLDPSQDPESQAKQMYPQAFLTRKWTDPAANQ
jgi:ABC-type transporter Mla subunit MlaD